MPLVNAGVDNNLGDSLTYEAEFGLPLDPPEGYEAIIGFVMSDADTNALDGMNPHRQRWSLKINRRFLPDGIMKTTHRLTCARLGGTWYRPGAGTIQQDGDYYLCELQKASA